MQNIEINAPAVNSVVRCGAGVFEKHIGAYRKGQVFVVTDTNVYALYAELIKNALGEVPVYVFPAGERSKTLTTLTRILGAMLSAGMTRSCTVIAFGGGVVGDVAGLAASLYMRGVRLVQVPTTLLSQVDSSVGGKTAVDFKGVKNTIGTFYQPCEVLADSLFLKTLPAREIRCGLGEIVKYGALDSGIYSMLKGRKVLSDIEFLESVTAPCIRHKAQVVRADERDLTGERKTLNLGHTTGHAFELYYKRKSHGEFVLIGMYYELFIAVRRQICAEQYADGLRALIKKAIKTVPAYPDAVTAALNAKFDKKNDSISEVSLIVPAEEGRSAEIKLPLEEYAEEIACCAEFIRSGKW